MNAIVKEAVETARFTKIGAAGEVLPASASEWDAVLDSRTGLMWAVRPIEVDDGEESTIQAAVKSCAAAGFTDWQAPDIDQLETIRDRTRRNPAIDTDFFPDTPSDWFWSTTPLARSSGYAWVVSFSYGYSGWYGRGSGGFVRAVRVGQ